MKWWWRRERQPPSIPEATEHTKRAELAKIEAARRHRELLDQQPEVWKAVHRAERLSRRNHFQEDLEQAIMRRGKPA